MNYFVDVSFDLSRENFNETKTNLIEIFQKYNGHRFYENFELSGINRVAKRNHCILTFCFEEDEEENVLKFVKIIRTIKRTNRVYIECVYNDYKIIYTSTKYRRIMSKFQLQQYNESLKNNKSGLNKNSDSFINLIQIVCKN
jgi:hypothetical protein